jgi:hypothetical protein
VLIFPDRLIIKYDATRSMRHQRQQIFHEIAHVLCDHRGDDVFEIGESALTEGLDLTRLQYVMHRGAFDCESETQAELVGTRMAVLSRGSVTDTRGGRLHRSAALVELLRK